MGISIRYISKKNEHRRLETHYLVFCRHNGSDQRSRDNRHASSGQLTTCPLAVTALPWSHRSSRLPRLRLMGHSSNFDLCHVRFRVLRVNEPQTNWHWNSQWVTHLTGSTQNASGEATQESGKDHNLDVLGHGQSAPAKKEGYH